MAPLIQQRLNHGQRLIGRKVLQRDGARRAGRGARTATFAQRRVDSHDVLPRVDSQRAISAVVLA